MRFRRVDRTEFRKVERERPSADRDPMGVPATFVAVKGARVYFSRAKNQITITADPVEDADPNGVIHNCDANGCGWEHVIARLDITEQQAKEFDICYMETKA